MISGPKLQNAAAGSICQLPRFLSTLGAVDEYHLMYLHKKIGMQVASKSQR
jgi:hypothetical protein